MLEEAECHCRNCGGNITFPVEKAGEKVACPHCQWETLLAINPGNIQTASEYEILQVIKKPDYFLHKEMQLGDANYILYLMPGNVRYLKLSDFIKYEPGQWISSFKQMSLTPDIQGPHVGEENELVPVIPEDFVSEPTWEDKFRILHSFAVLYRDHGVPSTVYKYFHFLTMVHSLEFTECINSWVKEAWKDYFIAQSYAKSDQYFIMRHGSESGDLEAVRFAVFKKTPFVAQKIEELRKIEEETQSAENLERLRKTSFTTFVYIMEDLRNGLFKIGQSQTPEKRENTLQSEVPEISLRFYIPAHDSAESELHVLFAEKRVRGEWFGLAPKDLLSVIEFLKLHGDLNRASVDYEWLGKISFGSLTAATS